MKPINRTDTTNSKVLALDATLVRTRALLLAWTFLLCALGAFASSRALAQNEFGLGSRAPGQLLLNLSATGQRDVPQDTLNASLQYSTQGRDRAKLQNEVNTAMRRALDILKDTSGVEYSTTQYQVYVIDAGRPSNTNIENPVWRAQQEVALKSLDSDALLEVMGKLQAAGLVATSQYYSLSPERYEEVAASLMQDALKKLQARADEAANGLDKGSAELIEVSLDGSPNFAFRERGAVMMSMDASAMATPVAVPGETTVSMTVSARALLSP
jgi:predicted secreted protein